MGACVSQEKPTLRVVTSVAGEARWRTRWAWRVDSPAKRPAVAFRAVLGVATVRAQRHHEYTRA